MGNRTVSEKNANPCREGRERRSHPFKFLSIFVRVVAANKLLLGNYSKEEWTIGRSNGETPTFAHLSAIERKLELESNHQDGKKGNLGTLKSVSSAY